MRINGHERREGAAMVEAVIAVPFFIVVFLGLIALHHAWQAGIRAQSEAREAAYRRSLAEDCGGFSAAADLLGLGDEADGALAGATDEALSLVDAVLGGGIFTLEHVRTEGLAEVHGVPGRFGGPAVRARAEAILICNERPAEGILDLVRQRLDALF